MYVNYHSFGLTMAGISSKAAGKMENRFKFNDGTELENKEFSDGSGLELYSTEFRSYDPQIGRFHQIDDLADIYLNYSPYVFANNNPIILNDPLGLSSDTTTLPEIVIQGGPPPPTKCLHCGISPVIPGSNPVSPSVVEGGASTTTSTTNELPPGEDITKWEDWAYNLNAMNPLANVVNGIKTYITGTDTYGVQQSNSQATVQIASALPIFRITSTLSNVSLSALRQGIAKTFANQRSLEHILKSKHKLDLLLAKAGSNKNIIRRLYLSLGQSGKLPVSGKFDFVVEIYGYPVEIRGAVVDGIPRIGTAFIR